MTKFEKIGLEELERLIIDAMNRSHEQSKGRMEHERMYIHSALKKAFAVCRELYPAEERNT